MGKSSLGEFRYMLLFLFVSLSLPRKLFTLVISVILRHLIFIDLFLCTVTEKEPYLCDIMY